MCSTLQLASLGPSLTVFNFGNYFFYFLNAATAVLVTKSLACDDEKRASDTLASAVFLAVALGATASALLIAFAPALISATGCVAELIPAAVNYLRVRALAQPIVLSTLVIQASLLAQLDVVTPFQVVLAACALNIAGDLLWVPALGAVGAALATLVSQLVALPLMLCLAALRKRLPIRLRRPNPVELRSFFATAAPLFLFEVGMSTCYALIQSLSTQFTVSGAAAFQALWTPLQVLEGVLLGVGDLTFLSRSQIGNVAIASACLACTKALGMGVHGTWVVFTAFIASRMAQASLRVFLQRRPWDSEVVCTV